MGSENRGMMEELHPLQLTGACLVSDRLEFRYRLDGWQPDTPGRITLARLIGPGVDLSLSQVVPGLLQAPVPEAGGRFTLAVDAVEGCADGVPPLPWHVDVHLRPEALADYLSAEPIGATADLPEGVVVSVGRILRRAGGVVLFWSGSIPGSDLALTGEIHGDLLAGEEPLIPTTYRFAPYGGQRKLRPAPTGKAASVMQIDVQAVEYVGNSADRPLVWQIGSGRLEAPGEWRLELTVPAERPAAMAPDLPVGTDGIKMRLEEVWLARSRTVLLFGGATGSLDLLGALQVEDESGRRYQATSASSDSMRTECCFEPVPPTVSHLVLTSKGAGIHVHGPVAIPLEPGARGGRVWEFQGHPSSRWASAEGLIPSSSRIVVEIPDVPPRDEPRPAMDAEEPPPGTPQLRAWLVERSLPALRMQFEPAERESLTPTESHIAGPPYWPAGEAWPVCGQCDRPLTFIGQVRLDGQGAPRIGNAELLTFHYCLECLPYGPEQASAYRLRLYRELAVTPLAAAPPPAADEYWDAVPCAVALLPVQSVPHWEDAKTQVAELDLGEDSWETYNTEAQALTAAPNLESRLGGYPDWIQGSYWPDCRECGEQMQLIWQLDSERETGLMWGDSGRVYIFACPRCANEQSLALVMQCG